MLNVSFLVPSMRRNFGGCAGNIAYNLRLLGGDGRADGDGRPRLRARTGSWLQRPRRRRLARPRGRRRVHRAGVHHDRPRRQPDHRLPPGRDEPVAPERRAARSPACTLGVVAPDGRDGMVQHAAQFAAAGIPLLFDPGQGLPMFDGAELLDFIVEVHVGRGQRLRRPAAAASARACRTARSRARSARYIVTSGAEGSVIHADGTRARDSGGARRRRSSIPTGCGDAYRAGLIFGLHERTRLGDHRPHRLADGLDQDRARRHAEPPLHDGRVPRPLPRGVRPRAVTPPAAGLRSPGPAVLLAAALLPSRPRAAETPGLGPDAGAHRAVRRHDRDRPDARLRHRVEPVEPGDGLRRRRRARPDPDQPPRRDAGPGGRDRGVPEPRGSRAARRSIATRCTTSASIATTRRSCASCSRRRCRSIRKARASAPRSACVGNDAGEQLSILAGTLARLDREAPEYGVGKYNDFNTFYIQAASGTSGGSSGSPVIDIQGRVVALNAGGSNGAASSFYLPLGRVQRALRADPAPASRSRAARCRRSSATRPTTSSCASACGPQTEAEARKARRRTSPACWSCDEVQPGSPTEGQLQPGDILVRVNGQLVDDLRAARRTCSTTRSAAGVDVEVERGGERSRRRCSWCRTCTRSRRRSTSSSATPWCTRCPTRWRGISTRRCAACSSPIPATCSARPACRAAR